MLGPKKVDIVTPCYVGVRNSLQSTWYARSAAAAVIILPAAQTALVNAAVFGLLLPFVAKVQLAQQGPDRGKLRSICPMMALPRPLTVAKIIAYGNEWAYRRRMGTRFGPVGDEVGTMVRFGDAFTARTLLDAAATGERLSVVEHLLAWRELGAPLHMHSREDEFTLITKGRVGFLLGDEVFYAGPGELVLKPRDQWHTFWNAGDEQARMLEIISPAGFEKYFEEIELFFPEGAPPDLEAMAEANARYGLQMDFDSLPQLIKRFDLTPPLEMGSPPPVQGV